MPSGGHHLAETCCCLCCAAIASSVGSCHILIPLLSTDACPAGLCCCPTVQLWPPQQALTQLDAFTHRTLILQRCSAVQLFCFLGTARFPHQCQCLTCRGVLLSCCAAMAFPVGFDSTGAPFALQLAAPAGQDGFLLSLGLALEKLFGPLPPPPTTAACSGCSSNVFYTNVSQFPLAPCLGVLCLFSHWVASVPLACSPNVWHRG